MLKVSQDCSFVIAPLILSDLYLLCMKTNYIGTKKQPENCENRNDSDLLQAFLKKWWAESDFKQTQTQITQIRHEPSYSTIYLI
jgi:hypothetical protein